MLKGFFPGTHPEPLPCNGFFLPVFLPRPGGLPYSSRLLLESALTPHQRKAIRPQRLGRGGTLPALFSSSIGWA